MKSVMRMTPQTKAVIATITELGHGSNMQILQKVRVWFPGLTATTVHRITNRLVVNGMLARGPEINGVVYVDANLAPHDHFICSACEGIKDVAISHSLRAELQEQVGVGILPTNFVIFGDCDTCISHL
jgi:Fur family transcriptional regulator, peroxide stress response regulator